MLIFDFVNEFNERQEITLDDFPIKITAVSPKGSEQMKKIFLKSASNLNGNLNCSKELEHYAS